jgi:sulfite dehydrogenase (cytochrome) subunit B
MSAKLDVKILWLAGFVLLPGHKAFADDMPMALKQGAGEDVATANCNACHTSDYIVMNSPFLTSDQWKAEVVKMRSAFAAPIDDETATAIVAYLATNYAVPKP